MSMTYPMQKTIKKNSVQFIGTLFILQRRQSKENTLSDESPAHQRISPHEEEMKKEDQIKKWIATWEKANSALTLVKSKDLRNKNYYMNNRALLNNMLQYAFDNHTVRKDSGLVAQQKIFKLLHTKP